MKFRAIATNEFDETFQFNFRNPNWNGVEFVAEQRLKELLEFDTLRQTMGPWSVTDIDVA